MDAITVDVFSDDEGEGWWWEAAQLRLRRGPFADQATADEDAVENAELLIAALAATHLRRR
jgi:hypothetical protein